MCNVSIEVTGGRVICYSNIIICFGSQSSDIELGKSISNCFYMGCSINGYCNETCCVFINCHIDYLIFTECDVCCIYDDCSIQLINYNPYFCFSSGIISITIIECHDTIYSNCEVAFIQCCMSVDNSHIIFSTR